MRWISCASLALLGCAPAASPPGILVKGPPPAAEAQAVVDAFLAVAARGDREAMHAFFTQHWSPRVPQPPEDERLDRIEQRRLLMGTVTPRPVELTAHGASVTACADHDGWISVEFFFEAAPPRKVLGIRSRPAVVPPALGLCGAVAAPTTPGEVAERLDAYMAARNASAPFSGVVLVGKGGAPVFARAYSFADQDAHAPNTVDTRFDIASESKMFTALAIEQLAEAGRLSLDDRVQRYLPDFGPPQLAPATITNLLTHTSGLGDIFRPPFEEQRQHLREPRDYLHAFAADLLEFPPGARGRYSNLGYMALGGIVEQVSGESYDAYVRDHVWAPAGMNDTSNGPYDAPMESRASGYTHDTLDHQWTHETRRADAFNVVKGAPACCTAASAPDMLRFATALLAGKLVKPETLARMTRGQVVLEGPGGVIDGRYGLGFIEETTGGVRHFGHGGGVPGSNSYFEVLPDRGYTVVVLANEDPPEATWVGDRIVTWLSALPPSP